ncbi:MAG: sn-glycerol-3-phosphate ABC transporter ATP-binding protein UgpC [Calditrichaeota bacterium]|nr:MAG: sn-glycerol-3-phosphate ABC transporter ATP-binding protein UgpC [Calditrichota bacterium]
MAKVELRRVSKVYGNKVTAIRDLDLVVEDREFTVLVGPSGCGKSTLLRMIAGLEEITSGELLIDGRRMNEVPPKDRDIAMVFQNYALYPHMSVFDNMAFGLKLRKFPRKEIEQRVREAAEILGLSQVLDRKPAALSGGQRQRVAVGRAIVRKPKVFLFDEPLSNLDAKLRVQMRIEINRLHQRLQTTMIYVTHDQVEAMTMGDRIVVLRDGVVQQVDTPLNLYNNPANLFVAGFIGSPSMNFLTGKLERAEGMVFNSNSFSLPLPPSLAEKCAPLVHRAVVLGIRPEHVMIYQTEKESGLAGPISAVVDVVEPIGNEVFVYFELANQTFCMRVPPEVTLTPGTKISVGFRTEHLYFFDPESEGRLV